ncbi:MAG: hypothetical protein DRP18_04415 [Candidatus Aenigmatarchaeota archaeon]|nr:MAG: hypothetical protein DRP18_04415 [Candidatus Aenigmarchaeota archaeon]
MKDILSILARQKQEIKEKLSKRIVERELADRIEKYLDKSPVKVISGARRSGKSVLSLLVLKSKKFGYVNFDEEEITKVKLDELISAVREIHGDIKFLLLDEIQNVSKWELWVNSLQRRGYNLIITGSNAKLLSRELATYLTGRYLEFENFPFSFREYLIWKGFDLKEIEYLKEKQGDLKNILREYIWKGGFPEYVVEELDREYLRTLFNSIIYADVVKRWNVRYPVKLEELARYFISLFAREYTATKLKNLLGFRSTFTVQNYIKYLEESFLIFSLERFSFKVKDFMKAPKKAYCIDTGLINTVSTRSTEDLGRLMENLVAVELKRRGFRENRELFYFRDENYEVDFVIKEGLKVKQLIQTTYASGRDEIERREIKSLLKASRELGCKNLLVITWDYEDEENLEGRRIRFLPLWRWMLNI